MISRVEVADGGGNDSYTKNVLPYNTKHIPQRDERWRPYGRAFGRKLDADDQ